MALYANYIPNPSFELGVTSWDIFASGTRSRVGSNASSGSYSMRVQRNALRNVFGGVSATVTIDAGGQPYSLSLNISGATEEHGATYNAGTKITVFDLLPGDPVSARQQLATQTFARTTNGRVAIRNFTPRPTANRIFVTIETASTYFQAGGYTYSGPFTQYFPVSQYGSHEAARSAAESFAASKWNATVDWNYMQGGATYYVTYYERTQLPDDSGGLATVYIDAVKLERGSVETAYVDGTTPGYRWEGDIHNSPTLNVAELSASGSGSLISPTPVVLLPVSFLQADGGGGLTGTAEMIAEGTVKASGTGELTGAAELWNYGPMSASGEGGVTGAAELYSIVSIEAHGTGGPGTGIYEPHAEMTVAWPTGADGYSELTGTIEMSFPQPISASGGGGLTGTAHVDIGLQLSASGFGELIGTATLDDAVPAGAFADFAIYGVATTDTDPLLLGLGPSNAGTHSGANNAAWTRIWGEFIAPADQPSSTGYAWRRAAYAAVGFRFDSVPAGNYQELTCVQVEPSTADNGPGPRLYSTAKTVRPLVHADRTNYANPDLWTFFGSQDISVTNGGASPITHDPRPIRVLTVTSDQATGFFGANMVTPPPGSHCVASIYLRGSVDISTVQVKVKDSDVDDIASAEIFLPVGDWVRVAVPFVVADSPSYIFAIEIPEAASYPATFEAAGFQVERGSTPGEYLGFIVGTRDYFYRYNGSDDTKGVFLYRNIDERIPLVTAALEEQMPLSMRASAPEFGLVPHLD